MVVRSRAHISMVVRSAPRHDGALRALRSWRVRSAVLVNVDAGGYPRKQAEVLGGEVPSEEPGLGRQLAAVLREAVGGSVVEMADNLQHGGGRACRGQGSDRLGDRSDAGKDNGYLLVDSQTGRSAFEHPRVA